MAEVEARGHNHTRDDPCCNALDLVAAVWTEDQGTSPRLPRKLHYEVAGFGLLWISPAYNAKSVSRADVSVIEIFVSVLICSKQCVLIFPEFHKHGVIVPFPRSH